MRRSWVRRRGERYVLVAREASVILIMRLTPAREDWPPVTSDIPRETGKTIGGDSNYMVIAGDHTVPAVEEMNSIGALLAERAFDFDQPLWEHAGGAGGRNRPIFTYLGEGGDAALIPIWLLRSPAVGSAVAEPEAHGPSLPPRVGVGFHTF